MKHLILYTLVVYGLLASLASAAITFHPHESGGDRKDWAFEAGVAFMTSNDIDEILTGDVNMADGPAGAEIYQLTAARRLGEFEWTLGDHVFRPQLELPLTLQIVDENGSSPFFNVKAGVTLRWVDFPWNDIVDTEFSMGLGLSYTEEIYLMDIQRHPGQDRSHVKFNWPIQLTFAHPDHPEHRLMLFIEHQSGGRIFDDGGFNGLGIGYRRDF